MVTPQKIIESFRSLPENTSVDEMIERILILDAIARGEKQIRDGQYYTKEEMKDIIYKLRRGV
jgi:predicted transcriptional regulator